MNDLAKDPLRLFVVQVEASELLRRLAELAEPLSIPLMPLKGALFSKWIYDAPRERTFSDLDILVPQGRWMELRHELKRAGFEQRFFAPHAVGLINPKRAVALDLHRALFAHSMFGLRTADVFRRSSTDTKLFGFAVAKMHPLDALLHSIGHLICGRHGKDAKQHRDIEQLFIRFPFELDAVVGHINQHGMRVASLVILRRITHPFARRVVVRLNISRNEALRATYYERMLDLHTERHGAPLIVGTHLMQDSLPHITRSLLTHGFDWLEQRRAH